MNSYAGRGRSKTALFQQKSECNWISVDIGANNPQYTIFFRLILHWKRLSLYGARESWYCGEVELNRLSLP